MAKNKLYIFLFVLLAGTSCISSKMNVTTIEYPKFDWQGHRGCRGLMPENTVAAMKHALELGVTTLEMDVVVTRDKKVILSHEPWFGHEITTKPDGSHVTSADEKKLNIYQMNYADVMQFDVGMKPHPRFPQQKKITAIKPTLEEVIGVAEKNTNGKIFYNIETKSTPFTDNIFHPQPQEFVDLIMKVIHDKKVSQRVTIQSFDIRTLQYLRANYPDVKNALLVEDFDKRTVSQQLERLTFYPTIYSPHYSLVTNEMIAFLHAMNVKVIPWTVNDEAEIKRLKDLGVDGIISDYPDLFKKFQY